MCGTEFNNKRNGKVRTDIKEVHKNSFKIKLIQHLIFNKKETMEFQVKITVFICLKNYTNLTKVDFYKIVAKIVAN